MHSQYFRSTTSTLSFDVYVEKKIKICKNNFPIVQILIGHIISEPLPNPKYVYFEIYFPWYTRVTVVFEFPNF